MNDISNADHLETEKEEAHAADLADIPVDPPVDPPVDASTERSATAPVNTAAAPPAGTSAGASANTPENTMTDSPVGAADAPPPGPLEDRGHFFTHMPGFKDRIICHRTHDENRRPGDCLIIFPQNVYKDITAHVSDDTSREYGGLLMGNEYYFLDSDQIVVEVTHAIPGNHTEGTSTRLTFTEDTWADFGDQTDRLKESGRQWKRVGWYHSHPGHRIFLSRYDLNVCETFNKPTHLALVVDPINDLGGFFVRGEDYYQPNNPQGFIEYCNDQVDSAITWKNLGRTTFEGITTGISLSEIGENEDRHRDTASQAPGVIRISGSAPANTPGHTGGNTIKRRTAALTAMSADPKQPAKYSVPLWVFIPGIVVSSVLVLLAGTIFSWTGGNDVVEEQKKTIDWQTAKIQTLNLKLNETEELLKLAREDARPEETPTPGQIPALTIPNPNDDAENEPPVRSAPVKSPASAAAAAGRAPVLKQGTGSTGTGQAGVGPAATPTPASPIVKTEDKKDEAKTETAKPPAVSSPTPKL